MQGILKIALKLGAVVTAIALFPDIAWADTTTGGAPWEAPIDAVVDSVTGPVAKGATAAAVCVAGVAAAYGEHGSAMRSAGKVGIGAGVAGSGATWLLPLVGFSTAGLL